MVLARRTRMLWAALALLVIAAVTWAAATALEGASVGADPDDGATSGTSVGVSTGTSADVPTPDESDLAYLWVRVTARDEEAQTLEVEVVDGELGEHRRGQVPVGATGTLDCSELLTGVGAIKPGATWVVSYVDEGQGALPVTLWGIESPEHFEGGE